MRRSEPGTRWAAFGAREEENLRFGAREEEDLRIPRSCRFLGCVSRGAADKVSCVAGQRFLPAAVASPARAPLNG